MHGLLLAGMLTLGMFVGGAGAGTAMLVAQANTPAAVAVAPPASTGSTALVTGATAGIGYAIAVQLAKEALSLAAAKLPIKTRFVQRIAE